MLPNKYSWKKPQTFLMRKSQHLKSFNEDGKEKLEIHDGKGQDAVLRGGIQS